ncbi:unnamed protein product [Closterium sp. Naga37s-1]|nr:unnamed protein product [Closterium sp. Naga37s-1]
MAALGRPHAVSRPAPALSPVRTPQFRPCCHRPHASPVVRHSPLPALSASPRRAPPGAAIGALQRGNGAAQGGGGLRGGETARAEAQSERAVDYSEGIRDRRIRRKGGKRRSDGDEGTGQMADDSTVQRGNGAVQTPSSCQQPVQPPSEPTASASSPPSPSLAHRLLSLRRGAQVQGEGRAKNAEGGGSRSGRSGEDGSSVVEAGTSTGGAAALNRRLVEATCLADVMQVVANEMARLPPRPEWHVLDAGAAARGAGVGDGLQRYGSRDSSKVRGHGKEARRSREEEEEEEKEMEEERREMERRWEEAAACALFSPINAVTALHRIARHMQAEGMSPPSRLALARTPPLRLLVAATLPAVRAARCNAQTLSNLAWALARIGGAGGGAGDMVAGQGAEGEAGGRGIGRRTWVYSEELDAVAAAVLPLQHTLAPQHIANIAAAFALARHLPAPALLPALAHQACLALPPLSSSFPTTPAHPSGRTLIMTAFSPPPPCPLACLRAWSPQHVANSVWALAVLQHTHGALFHTLWGEVLRRRAQFCGGGEEGEAEGEGSEGEQRARVGERHLSQLFQVAVTLRAEGAGGAVWHYSIDIALPGRRLAVEVDGPSHFTRNTCALLAPSASSRLASSHHVPFSPSCNLQLAILALASLSCSLTLPSLLIPCPPALPVTPLGATVLKRRHLEAAGWTVISIPFYHPCLSLCPPLTAVLCGAVEPAGR